MKFCNDVLSSCKLWILLACLLDREKGGLFRARRLATSRASSPRKDSALVTWVNAAMILLQLSAICLRFGKVCRSRAALTGGQEQRTSNRAHVLFGAVEIEMDQGRAHENVQPGVYVRAGGVPKDSLVERVFHLLPSKPVCDFHVAFRLASISWRHGPIRDSPSPTVNWKTLPHPPFIRRSRALRVWMARVKKNRTEPKQTAVGPKVDWSMSLLHEVLRSLTKLLASLLLVVMPLVLVASSC